MSVEIRLKFLIQQRLPRCAGYFARVHAYHVLVEQFLTLTNQQCQIVNLGAGFDTLYWLLHQKSLLPRLYVEVDFSNITTKKCHLVRYIYYIQAW